MKVFRENRLKIFTVALLGDSENGVMSMASRDVEERVSTVSRARSKAGQLEERAIHNPSLAQRANSGKQSTKVNLRVAPLS